MAQPIIQPNFAAGEISAALWARVDLTKFHSGLALCRNFFVDYHGGASNRPGTSFVGRCIDSTTANRLIPFTFSTLQTYALIFGNLTMRVITNGGLVTETAKNITGITNANPGVVTSAAHGYSNSDEVFITGINGLVGLNGRNFKVANVTANTFTLVDLWGVTINTMAMGAWTSGGTVARVYTLVTPYAAADLALLKYTQSADTMTLTHPSYVPYQLKRTGSASWTITAITYAPSTPAPGGAPTVTPSNAGGTTYKYVVTALINGHESLPSAVGSTAASATMSTTSGALETVDWSANLVTGAQSYNIYRTREIIGGAPTTGAMFGFVGSVDSTGSTFKDQNTLPDFSRTPPIANNPFAAGNNPFCSTYFQQRQVFGGTVNDPQGLVLSNVGDYLNMDYSSPSRDSDEIIVSLVSQQVNAIKNLVPMNSLIVLTANGAWKVDGGSQSDAITPTQINAVPQAYNGCADVPPIVVNYDILYVQAKGSIVRDLSYNFYVNIYTGADISVLSSHFFRGHQILEWSWSEEPYRIVWAVREDGVALTLTFIKDQDVFGWARHDTQGLFKSTCSISEGSENAVYFIVQRLINGQYVQYIERLASRNLGGDASINYPTDWTKAWFVDCGLQYPLGLPSAQLTPVLSDFVQNANDETWNGISTISSVSVTYGGSGYVSPTITVLDSPGSTGSGAILTPTLSGGVITSVTVNNGGSGYTNPRFVINDSIGTGAVLSGVIQIPVRFNASSAIFSAADIGKVLRINGGIGTVTANPSTTQITVNLTQVLRNLWPAASGSWSLTLPTLTVTGLHHLEGQTVSVLSDGNVMPSQVISNGSITLPEVGSSIVAGLSYRSRLQSLYLDTGEPTIQGKRKKLPAIILRVTETRGLKAGPTFDALEEFKERTNQIMGQAIPSITGDIRLVMDPAWQTQGQVCVQQDDPLPATVLGFIPEIVIGDTP